MYKVCSLFAGVGGIDLGFEQTGKFKTIWANEFDKNALLTYKSNFSTFVSDVDIRKVNVNDIPDVDIILSGFPCTSFSIARLSQRIWGWKIWGFVFWNAKSNCFKATKGISFRKC
nr:DNA (cytosine-5-)-methyltransferase [Mycoplasmopsis bovis]